MRPSAFAVSALLLAVPGCGRGDNAPGPGGVTVGEARALDEAAAMIETRRSPVESATPAPSSLPPAGSD